MKFVIVTDTHLGKKSNDEDNQLTLNLFKTICSTAEEKGIKKFIHLGDLFHGRTLSYKTMDYANQIGRMLSNTFEISYICVGNHDVHYKDQISPNGISPIFQPFPNIEVVDTITELDIDDIALFPWPTSENIHLLEEAESKVIIGHFGINELPMNRFGSYNIKEPLNISDFKDFKLVLSGHYHTPSERSNIKYLGSPYHMEFSDAGNRGYYIFDSEDISLEFIKFDSPKFKIYNVDSDEFTEEEIYGNHIRLDFPSKKENTEIENLIEKVENLGALSVKTKFNFQSEFEVKEQEKDISELGDNKEIMNDYIDNIEVPNGIKKDHLKSVMDNIFEESK